MPHLASPRLASPRPFSMSSFFRPKGWKDVGDLVHLHPFDLNYSNHAACDIIKLQKNCALS